MGDNNPNRRTFIKGISSAIALGFTGVASADDQSEGVVEPLGTGGVDNENKLPIYAEGHSIHKYKAENEDTYTYSRKFVSDDLSERYGNPIVEFEAIEVPAKYLSEEIQKKKVSTIKVDDKQVIGTAEEHNNAETVIKQKQRSGEVSVQTHLTDDLPLYHYASSSDAEDKQSRKAPINIGWEDGGSAESVKTILEEECNWSQYDWLPEEPRYINDNGTVKSTAEHVMDRIQFTKQWHVRLYNIHHPTYDVVGQVHKDPLNHNQGITIDDWNFDDAREQIVDDWTSKFPRSIYRALLNNGSDWDSHNGRIALLIP